jgi:hypothetical protein
VIDPPSSTVYPGGSPERSGDPPGGHLTRRYFGLLLLQALALFMWWPKSDLVDVLVTQSPPATLLALLVVVLPCMAYGQLRCGEALLAEMGPALAGAGWRRCLSAHLGAQIGVLLHALALSSPLVLIAWSVSPAPPSALLLGVAGGLVAVLAVGLLAAVIAMTLREAEALRFFAARAAAVVLLLLPGALWPPLNGFAWLRAQLGADGGVSAVSLVQGAGAVALPAYALTLMLLCGALALLLRRHGAADERSPA